MSTGSVQTILVCIASETPQAPCPSGMALATVQGYVLDVSQQASYEASMAPFDYVLAGGLWTFAFTFVVGLFLVSKSAGTVLSMIRR